MNFLDDVSILDMEELDLEESSRKTSVKCDSREIDKMRQADKKSMRTCHECGKKFLARLSCGEPWLYRDSYQGNPRWYCSYTCLSINRKKRARKS